MKNCNGEPIYENLVTELVAGVLLNKIRVSYVLHSRVITALYMRIKSASLLE
jgi:hypothetical protein